MFGDLIQKDKNIFNLNVITVNLYFIENQEIFSICMPSRKLKKFYK